MKTIAQREQIRKHLENGGTITQLEALRKFDCNHPEPFCQHNKKGFCKSKVGCNFKTES